jgi:hypothetical protein
VNDRQGRLKNIRKGKDNAVPVRAMKPYRKRDGAPRMLNPYPANVENMVNF